MKKQLIKSVKIGIIGLILGGFVLAAAPNAFSNGRTDDPPTGTGTVPMPKPPPPR